MTGTADGAHPVTVRAGRPEDASALRAIYAHAVRASIATFDLEEPGEAHFAQVLAHPNPTLPLLVASAGDRVVGYAYASVYRVRPAYAATRETSIYLDPAWIGRGIGRTTYAALLRHLDDVGCHTELAVIALPNPASIALHTSLGFTHVGTMREVGRKFDRWIDTAWYQRRAPLTDGPARPGAPTSRDTASP